MQLKMRTPALPHRKDDYGCFSPQVKWFRLAGREAALDLHCRGKYLTVAELPPQPGMHERAAAKGAKQCSYQNYAMGGGGGGGGGGGRVHQLHHYDIIVKSS